MFYLSSERTGIRSLKNKALITVSTGRMVGKPAKCSCFIASNYHQNHPLANEGVVNRNRPFSYSTKEPGSSDIFIQFYTRGSIEWP